MNTMTAPSALSAENSRRAILDYLRACGEPECEVRSLILDNPSVGRVVAVCEAIAPAGSARAGRCFIAKTFSDDTGVRTFAVMRALEQALSQRAAAAPTLAVPRALWYDAVQRCLVQERVEAPSIASLSRRPAIAEAMQATGVALAELHALDLPKLPVRNFDEHVGDLMRPHPEALAERCPELARALRAVLEGCREATAGAEANLPAILHRDFHPRQIFHDRRHVWVIDWDLAAAGDPALDVGNFLMLLGLKYGGGPLSRFMAEAFLAGYATRSAAWPSMRARVSGWQAATCLRRACKAVRLAGDAGRDEAGRLLVAAERLLSNPGGIGR